MIVKNLTDVIKEAAKSEEFQNIEEDVSELIDDELKTNYAECIKDMPIISKELVAYKAEMVPVFKNESSYFIEMDNIVKYMTAWNIKDIKEAMTNIAEANEISTSELSLVIESKEYMSSILEHAIDLSNKGDKSLLEDCELAIKLINLLKTEGVNVVLTH